jgi:hypothetical protein
MKCDTKALGHSIQGATTLSITRFSIKTFSILTLGIKGIFETLSINDIQHNSTSAIMLNVIILSVMIYILLG